jgi:hypothetical protein
LNLALSMISKYISPKKTHLETIFFQKQVRIIFFILWKKLVRKLSEKQCPCLRCLFGGYIFSGLKLFILCFHCSIVNIYSALPFSWNLLQWYLCKKWKLSNYFHRGTVPMTLCLIAKKTQNLWARVSSTPISRQGSMHQRSPCLPGRCSALWGKSLLSRIAELRRRNAD